MGYGFWFRSWVILTDKLLIFEYFLSFLFQKLNKPMKTLQISQFLLIKTHCNMKRSREKPGIDVITVKENILPDRYVRYTVTLYLTLSYFLNIIRNWFLYMYICSLYLEIHYTILNYQVLKGIHYTILNYQVIKEIHHTILNYQVS